ncbi:UvrB/UvrC motif-containing protein [Amycolatopsis japonica]|uniref:UvrB/UvrC motif-containing protein n=1 Tax=Amycolatopsis japonica TaxID=208439 RepID=UPI0033F14B1E
MPPCGPAVEIEALTSEIAEYRRRKEAAVDAQEYTQAALVRDKEKAVERRRSGGPGRGGRFTAGNYRHPAPHLVD